MKLSGRECEGEAGWGDGSSGGAAGVIVSVVDCDVRFEGGSGGELRMGLVRIGEKGGKYLVGCVCPGT